jgi:cytochrome c-type biogenesis protein CcmH
MLRLIPAGGKQLRILGAVLLGAILLMGASDNSARMDRLGHQMMCVCSCGQILLECNHVGCTYSATMRHELAAAIDSGAGDNDVLQTFITKYGATVLAAPTHTGFDRVAWLMPPFALVVGIGGAVLIVRIWRHRSPLKRAAANSGVSDDALKRLREKVRAETEL